MNKQAGFTLLEVLIALAILAIAMAAVARASMQMTDSSNELKRRLLANWVADNRLAEHMARSEWPPVGLSNGVEDQAGLSLRWEENVSNSPNIAFRRVEIKVYAGSDKQSLSQIVGYLGRGKE